jgi:hypothetical protein
MSFIHYRVANKITYNAKPGNMREKLFKTIFTPKFSKEKKTQLKL